LPLLGVTEIVTGNSGGVAVGFVQDIPVNNVILSKKAKITKHMRIVVIYWNRPPFVNAPRPLTRARRTVRLKHIILTMGNNG